MHRAFSLRRAADPDAARKVDSPRPLWLSSSAQNTAHLNFAPARRVKSFLPALQPRPQPFPNRGTPLFIIRVSSRRHTGGPACYCLGARSYILNTAAAFWCHWWSSSARKVCLQPASDKLPTRHAQQSQPTLVIGVPLVYNMKGRLCKSGGGALERWMVYVREGTHYIRPGVYVRDIKEARFTLQRGVRIREARMFTIKKGLRSALEKVGSRQVYGERGDPRAERGGLRQRGQVY